MMTGSKRKYKQNHKNKTKIIIKYSSICMYFKMQNNQIMVWWLFDHPVCS